MEAIIEASVERLDHAAGEVSLQSVLLAPVILCVLMLVVGWTVSALASVRIGGLFLPYLSAAVLCTIASVGVFAFIEIAKLARDLADHPLGTVGRKILERLPLLLLPALIFPIFLCGFTAAKASIPYLVPYSWDAFFAKADAFIFGDDAWRIAYRAVGTRAFWLFQLLYTLGWGFAFLISGNAVALYASRRMNAVFFTAMFATWLVGGCFLAYAFSSAGPVFASNFDPSLHARFDPIRSIVTGASGGGSVDLTQRYLMAAVSSHVAVKGGGISAMPSMHLGAAAIYVLAARGTKLLVPAILFWIGIFFCSAYFGYHYWVDGIAGALVAWICWNLAKFFYSDREAPVAREVR